jgi:hypothetical protein
MHFASGPVFDEAACFCRGRSRIGVRDAPEAKGGDVVIGERPTNAQ